MTPGNIGVVFGPTLMRPEIVIPLIDISESGTKSHCIEYIVRNFDALFADCDNESLAGDRVMIRKKKGMTGESSFMNGSGELPLPSLPNDGFLEVADKSESSMFMS